MVKHTMYDKTTKKLAPKKIVLHLIDELPQCDTRCHTYSKYRCVPTPRPPRVRPDMILFTITSIIVSLPRSRRESDDISLPRSVVRMCLIMMLNLLLFSRFFFKFVFAQATKLARTVSKRTHTLSAHQYRGLRRQLTNNPFLLVISYRSRRRPLWTLPCSLPVPHMKRFAFDVASCSR